MLVHTIWIQDPESARRFGLGEWLSIVSLLKNTSYRCVLHTNLEADPANPYCPYRITHERFFINQRPYDMKICGVRARPANISDMERIRLLYTSGGMYADLDIWWLQDMDLSCTGPIVTAYENPSYKTVANAFIVAKEASWPPFLKLLDLMHGRFAALAARGITDLRGDPVSGLSKNHTLLWKLTGDFLKEQGASVLGRVHFYKNGWRRIGRELLRNGVPLNPVVDQELLGKTADTLSLEGIAGFHYYAGLFTAGQVLSVPKIRDAFQMTVDWGAASGWCSL